MINNGMPIGLGVCCNYLYQFLKRNCQFLGFIHIELFPKLIFLKHVFLLLYRSKSILNQIYTYSKTYVVKSFLNIRNSSQEIELICLRNNKEYLKQYLISAIYSCLNATNNKGLTKSLSEYIYP